MIIKDDWHDFLDKHYNKHFVDSTNSLLNGSLKEQAVGMSLKEMEKAINEDIEKMISDLSLKLAKKREDNF